MAAAIIAMNSPEAAALQDSVRKDMIERGWQAPEDAGTLSEYAVIMLINGKPEEQVDAELSEIIPDYDFGFGKWFFDEAKRIASGAESSAAAQDAPPAPSSPAHRPLSPPQSPPRASPNGASSLKRPRSRSPSPANKAPRTADAPNAPRAMRDKPARPDGDRPPRVGGAAPRRSLLERMGPRVQQRNDEIQARINAITGIGAPGFQPPQQNWQGPMGGPMPMNNMGDMPTMEMQQKWQEMMTMQMAMMQQMAMMNGGMPFMQPGMNQNMQGNGPRNDNARGRGRGRGRGGHAGGGHFQNAAAEQGVFPAPTTSISTPPTVLTAAPAIPPASSASAAKTIPASATLPAVSTTSKAVLCKFGLKCTNLSCPYAHPSPAASIETGLVLSDEICPDGKNCKNAECVKVHPSPAKAEAKAIAPTTSQGIMCRFGANCTRPDCVFTHPWDKSSQSSTPCRYGVACTRADCVFSHPPGRSLPSTFHKGLDSSSGASVQTPTTRLNGAAAPFVSKNISQVYTPGSKAATVPTAVDAVVGAAQATVNGAVGAAAETLENAVDATKDTIAKVEGKEGLAVAT